jgi:hypothetical protein
MHDYDPASGQRATWPKPSQTPPSRQAQGGPGRTTTTTPSRAEPRGAEAEQLLERSSIDPGAPAVLTRLTSCRQSGKFRHPLNCAAYQPVGPHTNRLAGRASPLFLSASISGSSARSQILLSIPSACSPDITIPATSSWDLPNFEPLPRASGRGTRSPTLVFSLLSPRPARAGPRRAHFNSPPLAFPGPDRTVCSGPLAPCLDLS